MLSLAVVKTGLVQFGGKALIMGQKYAPQIMTYSGIAGFVGTVIFGCKATTKAEKILQDRDAKLDAVQQCKNDPSIEYTAEDEEKDIHDINVQARWELTKCYAPVVTLGLASTALILGGHHIIQTRAAGYAAAYKASEKAFRAYRDAVGRKYGEDPDRITLSEDGNHALTVAEQKTETSEKTSLPVPTDIPSAYLAWFCGDTSSQWLNSPQMNWYFLTKVQNELNDKLRSEGYVFLNDARKALGLPYIPEGQFLGWVLRNDRKDGDNYIDFLHNGPGEKPNDTVEALQRLEDVPILLEFNCDGLVHEEVAEIVRERIPKQWRRPRGCYA